MVVTSVLIAALLFLHHSKSEKAPGKTVSMMMAILRF